VPRLTRKSPTVSHHFDTPTAREDPRLNLCDFYLFAGSTPGTTAMAMTVNPAADAQTTAPFREEAIYAFRFATDGDGRDEVAFKVRFSDSTGPQPSSAADGGQLLEVRRAVALPDGPDGELLMHGRTDEIGVGEYGIRVFAGVVGDAFTGDATALEAFKAAAAQGRYRRQEFTHRVNFFGDRMVAAIVLEVPNTLIANISRVHSWATVTLYGHAPMQQVARWGLPLLTHLFLEGDLRERFNRTRPGDDDALLRSAIAATTAKYAAMAETTTDPAAYGHRVADLFGGLTLPYELGTVASFDYTGFNGRALHDNVMDVMLSLLTNSPLGIGVAPDRGRYTTTFPYLRPAGVG